MNNNNYFDTTNIIFSSKDDSNHNELLMKYNKIIQENINKEAKLTNYIGKGYHGMIFSSKLKDIDTVCKVIELGKRGSDTSSDSDTNDSEINKNIFIELSILRMLTNMTKIKYIIPCLYFRMYENKLYSFFPVFEGKTLSDIKKHLSKLNDEQYINIIGLVIKHLLLSLSIIHSQNIAHQNLDDMNILINFKPNTIFNEQEFELRLINFGLSCGFYNVPVNISIDDNLMNIEQKYLSDQDIVDGSNKKIYKNCLEIPKYFLSNKNMNKSVKLIDNLIKKMTKDVNNEELIQLSQKYDIWCCGIIIYDLIYSKWSNGYNQSMLDGYDNHMSWLKKININEKNKQNDINDKFLTGKLLKFISVVKKHMLVPVSKRWDSKHLLDHFVANY